MFEAEAADDERSRQFGRRWLEADGETIRMLCPAAQRPEAIDTLQACYDALYSHFRFLPEPIPSGLDEVEAWDFQQRYGQGALGMRIVKNQGQQIMRMPAVEKPGTPGIRQRIALNVRPDTALLDELDAFCCTYNAGYKILFDDPKKEFDNPRAWREPEIFALGAWEKREDPVNIYLDGQATDAMKNDIIAIAARYAREGAADRKMLGENIAPGVSLTDSPHEYEASSRLVGRAAKLGPIFIRFISHQCLGGVSLGSVAAMDRMLSMAEAYKARITGRVQGGSAQLG